MGAAGQCVILGCARVGIRAPIVLLRGATIVTARLCTLGFYGAESELDCEIIFRARGSYTSSPHIVLR